MNDRVTNSIIRTKLHKPRILEDHIHRARLVERLQQYSQRPATLVIAPAGYGKSTLVSCWIDEVTTPYVWLSLDDNDNDLQTFLFYFTTAVQSLFPEATSQTASIVEAPSLIPIESITTALANELDAVEQNFILILDDIHRIHEKTIHDLLDELLRNPPRPMHLVLIGRRDPFISLPILRGRGQLGEIRLQDLRFTGEETAAYLQQGIEEPIDKDVSAAWAEKMEGWVTGLRLTSLSMRHGGTLKTILPKIKGNVQYVMEYLFSEVMLLQPPAIRDCMMKVSILNRFCATLSHEVCTTANDPDGQHQDAWKFIQFLKKENIFLINLDDENQWFRFHHLFQQLLQNQFKRHFPPEAIAEVHSRASGWFESQGAIGESIEHALAAGDDIRAAEIIEAHHHTEFSADRWFVVKQWLDMLPAEIRQTRLKLLLDDAWIANLQHQLERAKTILARAESLLPDQAANPMVSGEFAYLQGYVLYYEGQAEPSRRLFEKAVKLLLGSTSPFLGEAELMIGLARCMDGQKDAAVSALKMRMASINPAETYLFSRLIASLTFIHLLSGELLLARVAGQQLLQVATLHNMRLTEAWSHYFIACTHLHTGEFKTASIHFGRAVNMRYVLEPRAAVDALAGLALTQQLMGFSKEARASCRQLDEFALDLGEQSYLFVAHSTKARLAVLQSDTASAMAWCSSVDESPLLAETWSWIEAPSITQARGLIADGTKENLEKAAGLLETICQQCEAAHITCQIIEAIVLQSLVMEKLGCEDQALVILRQAISKAEPHGWIRPFVEAGPPMVNLLKRLQQQNISVAFIETLVSYIQQTFSEPVEKKTGHKIRQAPEVSVYPSETPYPLVDPLTNRELDILELLDRRLQNKEIADELSISSSTVKSHLRNIFKKLNVSNRREAITEARRLNIIT